MDRKFKIAYYVLVAFFMAVFTYEIYQLATIFLQRPARHVVMEAD